MSSPSKPSNPDAEPVTPDAEMLSFGGGDTDVVSGPGAPTPGARSGAPDLADVDAWFEEPSSPAEAEPTWLSERWKRWRQLDPDRRLIVVLVAIAVLALVAALIGLTTRDDPPPIELPAVEAHGLDTGQAACFEFGRIENRLTARLGADLVYAGLGSVAVPLNQEIADLDEMGARYPEADYRLIASFAAVADASSKAVDANIDVVLDEAIDAHIKGVAEAGSTCSEVADFDVAKLQPQD